MDLDLNPPNRKLSSPPKWKSSILPTFQQIAFSHGLNFLRIVEAANLKLAAKLKRGRRKEGEREATAPSCSIKPQNKTRNHFNSFYNFSTQEKTSAVCCCFLQSPQCRNSILTTTAEAAAAELMLISLAADTSLLSLSFSLSLCCSYSKPATVTFALVTSKRKLIGSWIQKTF